MSKDEIYGIVYMVKNLITQKLYIGATTKSVKKRKSDHLSRSKKTQSSKFYNSISTYGPEAFEWKQIDTAIDANDLAEKESNYIIRYDTLEDGLNEIGGGGFKKVVYQYDLDSGLLLLSFKSLDSAAKAVNAKKYMIARACINTNQKCNGYYWSYEKFDKFIPKGDSRKKEVYQIHFNNKVINRFNSIAEASELTRINKTSIAKVCRGERYHAGGFKWSYK